MNKRVLLVFTFIAMIILILSNTFPKSDSTTGYALNEDKGDLDFTRFQHFRKVVPLDQVIEGDRIYDLSRIGEDMLSLANLDRINYELEVKGSYGVGIRSSKGGQNDQDNDHWWGSI